MSLLALAESAALQRKPENQFISLSVVCVTPAALLQSSCKFRNMLSYIEWYMALAEKQSVVGQKIAVSIYMMQSAIVNRETSQKKEKILKTHFVRSTLTI